MRWVYFSGQSKNEVFPTHEHSGLFFLLTQLYQPWGKKCVKILQTWDLDLKKNKNPDFSSKKKSRSQTKPSVTQWDFSHCPYEVLSVGKTSSWCHEEHIFSEVPGLGHPEVWSAGLWAELYFHLELRPLEHKTGVNICQKDLFHAQIVDDFAIQQAYPQIFFFSIYLSSLRVNTWQISWFLFKLLWVIFTRGMWVKGILKAYFSPESPERGPQKNIFPISPPCQIMRPKTSF